MENMEEEFEEPLKSDQILCKIHSECVENMGYMIQPLDLMKTVWQNKVCGKKIH